MDTPADIVARLASPKPGRTEADLQSDVRKLLLDAPLSISDEDVAEIALEAQVGGGRRIDVEIGSAAIECKRTLTASASDLKKWEEQLAGYVRDRTEQLGRRYIGILTDGARWRLYHLIPSGTVAFVDEIDVAGRDDAERLVSWLDAVLATTEHLTPTPELISRRLGAGSPSFDLDLADLHALYAAVRNDPEVRVKRELWTRLLAAALGTNFEASDSLFVTHTYLVLTAELIAHAVIGLPVDTPGGNVRDLLEGQVFDQAGLHGIVEADFFDWPAVAPQGAPIVRAIGRRLGRYDWTQVGHDVMKALYESVIDTETRQRLGEYYTPDWLAQRMVRETFKDPSTERLLDPSCGSGTFLFWAVRHALAHFDAEGLSNREALELLVSRVHGIDLHPVAVTLARVTYLLAIGPERIKDRGELTIPVFLGDSVRWEQENTLFSDGGITIKTTDGMELFTDRQLHFPEGVLTDPTRFDRLVDALATKAADRVPGTKPPPVTGILNRHSVPADDREAVEIVFKQLCHLHDAGRDHVWGTTSETLPAP
ncbi:N-6 DNA methylase [Patulibacter sp. NPDC049589]|uniref:N-6 DNA methylase n=1 Tax=Patulibacter sp. NPDC049589 TaxID=3154731 RepID=UPI003437F03A